MEKVTKFSNYRWLPRILFLVLAAGCLWQYLQYMSAVVPLQYEWGPSDGDHLNFARRLALGQPIYLSMKEGEVLSIYTPLYHGLIALIGGSHASFALARFIAREFDIITTGLQSYPKKIQEAIEHSYQVGLTVETVLFAGNTGLVEVYVPKKTIK